MTTSPREPTAAEIEAIAPNITCVEWPYAPESHRDLIRQDIAAVWPIAYAAGVRDQEAEDFAELNHMSTQCDRANEVAANAEERCERVVKALAGLLDALSVGLGITTKGGFIPCTVGIADARAKAEAALKEAQDALRAHERSEHGADPELLH